MVAPEDYESTPRPPARRLEAFRRPRAGRSARGSYKPEDVYRQVDGAPPDLFVYFGDLRWRSVGTVGGTLHTFENDTGPDDANHAQDGLFIMAAPGVEPGERSGMHLLDIAPTVLDLFGLETPATMRGSSLLLPRTLQREGFRSRDLRAEHPAFLVDCPDRGLCGDPRGTGADLSHRCQLRLATRVHRAGDDLVRRFDGAPGDSPSGPYLRSEPAIRPARPASTG